MHASDLEDRLRTTLGLQGRPEFDVSIRFAVEYARLLARSVPGDPDELSYARMLRAIADRCVLDEDAAGILLRLALAPESRWEVTDHELRAFSGRFGAGEGQALRVSVAAELTLAAFADRYGAEEALLLLDALFAVAAVDGVIDRDEIGRLQRAARELGIDSALVSALFRNHDVRHANGDFTFPLTGDRLRIGRRAGSDIHLPDPLVAPSHAELVLTDGVWRVKDLDTGRPTLVNGTAVRSAPLLPGHSLRIGPYTLQIDAHGKTLTAFGAARFSSLSVRGLSRRIGDTHLLDGVDFTVFSGEVVAVVGPSGSGKTTLLNAITGVAPADVGEVFLDGEAFHELLAADESVVGIVPQDDVIHAELTVEESLQYAARLRFPAHVGPEALQGEVDRVLEELGIDHIRGNRIGDVVRRGISGGQRKRVNLGQELLTRSTRVLFLDEPTSGLDPQTAQDIVGLVRTLADGGRIVFLVTHDLSPSILAMVDHLLVLAPGGRVAWFGPPAEASAYFKVDSPDELFKELPTRTPQSWRDRFRDSTAHRQFVRTRQHLLRFEAPDTAAERTRATVRRALWMQYVTLCRRTIQVKLRDAGGMAVALAQAPILALAMVLVFPKADTGTMFMLALSSLWFGASGSVRELIAERAIWRREARLGLRTLPYVASKMSVLGLLVAFQCTLMTSLTWAALGMGGSGEHPLGYDLLHMCGVTTLTGWVGVSMGLVLSASFRTTEAAVAALPILLIPQITFGGLLVKVKQMSAVATGISWLMITRFSFDALIKTGDQLWVPQTGFQSKEPLPIMGVLSDLGFRPRGASVSDLGLTLWELVGIELLFLVGCLLTTGILTHRTGKRP